MTNVRMTNRSTPHKLTSVVVRNSRYPLNPRRCKIAV